MAKRTVHIPDDLDSRVLDVSTVEDSYSSLVQDGLRSVVRARESDEQQEIEA